MIEIVNATAAHIEELSDNLRQADRLECERAGVEPRWGIRRSFELSLVARAALCDGRVLAVWGVGGEVIGDDGRVWLFTANGFEKHAKAMFRASRELLAEMLEIFAYLYNFVDAEYEQALRFMKHLGFSIGEPQDVFGTGSLFCKIEKRR